MKSRMESFFLCKADLQSVERMERHCGGEKMGTGPRGRGEIRRRGAVNARSRGLFFREWGGGDCGRASLQQQSQGCSGWEDPRHLPKLPLRSGEKRGRRRFRPYREFLARDGVGPIGEKAGVGRACLLLGRLIVTTVLRPEGFDFFQNGRDFRDGGTLLQGRVTAGKAAEMHKVERTGICCLRIQKRAKRSLWNLRLECGECVNRKTGVVEIRISVSITESQSGFC